MAAPTSRFRERRPTMKRIALATMLLLGLGLPVSGCDQTIIDDVPFERYDLAGATPDGGMTLIPGKPLLGMLIDRAGRPGINLMLTDPFDKVNGATPDMVKTQYNAAVAANWSAYAAKPYIAANLAILDGIDGM